MTRETGFFQAPPQTGSFQGASRSWGISGGAIVFPEWRLRLPYVELPALSRTRESARMRIHAAEAPWISTGFEAVRMGPAVAAAPAAPTGRAAPTPPSTEDVTPRGADEDCEVLRRRYEQQIQQLERQLEQCEQLTRALQQQMRQPPAVSVEDDQPRPSPQPGSPIQAPVPEVDMGRLPPVPSAPAEVLHRAESWATPATYLTPSGRSPALEIPRRLPPVAAPAR
ncbi:MAG: hypothetical protein AB7O38_10295 [Pirellulaceae bacterium]